MVPSQKLVLAPGAIIRGNTVYIPPPVSVSATDLNNKTQVQLWTMNLDYAGGRHALTPCAYILVLRKEHKGLQAFIVFSGLFLSRVKRHVNRDVDCPTIR